MTAESETLQIKVTLVGIRPPIWRRLVIHGDATLEQLHFALQVAMGWENCHLHCFRIGDARYGPADSGGFGVGEIDESKVRVGEVFATSGRGVYEYDFGDSWEHELLVEKTGVPIAPGAMATCMAGKRSCPPEDCGGIFGYMNLLGALGDPAHEEHEELLEWVDQDFDSELFDQEAVNAILQRIRVG